MNILIDMNLSPLWVPYLERFGHRCFHWSSIGSPRAPDREILQYARDMQMVVFTRDLDFGWLLAIEQTKQPSVVQLRTQDVLPVAVGAVVARALQASQAELELGALVTIDLNRERIRVLPLGR